MWPGIGSRKTRPHCLAKASAANRSQPWYAELGPMLARSPNLRTVLEFFFMIDRPGITRLNSNTLRSG
jgi:hypothetical protein